jgi:hypothetical protein
MAAAVGSAAFAWAAQYPLGGFWAAGGFALAAMLVVRTNWTLAAIPIALVAGDLYPWTGCLLITEADLFLAFMLATMLWRGDVECQILRKEKWFWILWGPFACSAALSFLKGWCNLPPSSVGDQLSIYGSQWNSVRVFKGYAVTCLLAILIVGGQRCRATSYRDFFRGLQISALFVGLAVVWERCISVGLFNFSQEYRATGPFYSMHAGGQCIDAFWAIGFPFLFLPQTRGYHGMAWIGRSALVAVSFYAIGATMSRGVIVLTGCVALVLAVLTIVVTWRESRGRSWSFIATILLVGAALGFMFVNCDPMRRRFSNAESDWHARWNLWATLCRTVDQDCSSLMIGKGIGVLPNLIADLEKKPSRPTELVVGPDGGVALRLEPGRSVHVEQLVDVQRAGPWMLTGSFRRVGAVSVHALVCQKTLLSSFHCVESDVDVSTKGSDWQPIERAIDIGALASRPNFLPYCPTTFALSVSGDNGRVDIQNLRLEDAHGTSVLKNSEFRSGSAYWFFISDDFAVWRAENLWVHLYVEQGWLGVAAFAWLIAGTLVPLVRRATHGPDIISCVLVAAIIGFVSMGLFGTLIDTPWLTELFCALLAVSQAFTQCLIKPIQVPKVDPNIPQKNTKQSRLSNALASAMQLARYAWVDSRMPRIMSRRNDILDELWRPLRGR